MNQTRAPKKSPKKKLIRGGEWTWERRIPSKISARWRIAAALEGQAPACPQAVMWARNRARRSVPLQVDRRGRVEGQAPACPRVMARARNRARRSVPLQVERRR